LLLSTGHMVLMLGLIIPLLGQFRDTLCRQKYWLPKFVPIDLLLKLRWTDCCWDAIIDFPVFLPPTFIVAIQFTELRVSCTTRPYLPFETLHGTAKLKVRNLHWKFLLLLRNSLVWNLWEINSRDISMWGKLLCCYRCMLAGFSHCLWICSAVLVPLWWGRCWVWIPEIVHDLIPGTTTPLVCNWWRVGGLLAM